MSAQEEKQGPFSNGIVEIQKVYHDKSGTLTIEKAVTVDSEGNETGEDPLFVAEFIAGINGQPVPMKMVMDNVKTLKEAVDRFEEFARKRLDAFKQEMQQPRIVTPQSQPAPNLFRGD